MYVCLSFPWYCWLLWAFRAYVRTCEDPVNKEGKRRAKKNIVALMELAVEGLEGFKEELKTGIIREGSLRTVS